jgi:translation initiation factor IF-3
VDPEGNQIGVIAISEALNRARDAGLDLVEVAPQSQPPVCRIMDYGKFKFEQAKKDRSGKKNAAANKVKEIKFHANVEEHDYTTKLSRIREFLEEGHRVKVSLAFRGRENAHKEFGYQVIRRVLDDVEDIGTGDKSPQQMGRFLFTLITPKRPEVRSKS